MRVVCDTVDDRNRTGPVVSHSVGDEIRNGQPYQRVARVVQEQIVWSKRSNENSASVHRADGGDHAADGAVEVYQRQWNEGAGQNVIGKGLDRGSVHEYQSVPVIAHRHVAEGRG